MIYRKTVTLNPGESQQIDFSASFSELGSHVVSVDGLSGTFDVLAKPEFEIDLGAISVFVDGHPFGSVSGHTGVMPAPITVPNLTDPGLILKIRSKTLCYSPYGMIGLYIHYMFQPTGVSQGPGYQLGRSDDTWNCSERILAFPFNEAGVWAQDYWHPGVYNLWGIVSALNWDGEGGQISSFYINNFVYCTSSGNNIYF